MVKNADETKGYHEFISGDATSVTSYHPFASILYINSIGLEDGWSYHAQAAGRAGTAAVNDYTGGLCLVHSDASVDAGAFPLALSHVFNTGDKDVNEGYGLGWRLNYAETVKKITIGEKAYYRLIDGDGTATTTIRTARIPACGTTSRIRRTS